MLSVALRRQDTWAGIMFLFFGAAALYFGRTYSMGSASVMGPGYFPRLLGGLLCVFGAAIAAKGALQSGPTFDRVRARPFLILLAVILFGVLMAGGGLILAVTVLIVIGAAAGDEFRLVEALVMAAALCLFSVAVFNWGLGLHMPLWPAW